MSYALNFQVRRAQRQDDFSDFAWRVNVKIAALPAIEIGASIIWLLKFDSWYRDDLSHEKEAVQLTFRTLKLRKTTNRTRDRDPNLFS